MTAGIFEGFKPAARARTRIIATIGPASSSSATLRKIVEAGVNAVRFNFSHGNIDEHARRLSLLREINRKRRRAVAALADLEGPRIRVGALGGRDSLFLKRGETVALTNDESSEKTAGARRTIYFDYRGNLAAVRPRTEIFIDDGNIKLLALRSSARFIETRVESEGHLRPRKGVNIPGARLSFPTMSPKDAAAVKWAAENSVEYIAQSFVTDASQIAEVRRVARRAAKESGIPRAPEIIAKIENRDGLRNIDSIIKAADGIMIARGDLGISVPLWEVPFIQKFIIGKCGAAGKFSIVATQMLESMTNSPLPTRAEVSDVANAVLDGADYVMLSAETAVGKYPAEAVGTMDKIIKYAEAAAVGTR